MGYGQGSRPEGPAEAAVKTGRGRQNRTEERRGAGKERRRRNRRASSLPGEEESAREAPRERPTDYRLTAREDPEEADACFPLATAQWVT